MRVGLTGGVASGKSTVSAILAELGAVVIDADQLAREVVAPGTDGLAEVVAAFGEDVLTAEGELDRPAMGAIVFADPEKRRVLESIIHPRVRARAAEIEAAAPPGAVVVHDIPLLAETGQGDGFDAVVVVDVPAEVQVERMTGIRGMTPRTPRPASAPRRLGSSGARSRRTSSTTPARSRSSARRSSACSTSSRPGPEGHPEGRRGPHHVVVRPSCASPGWTPAVQGGQAARSGSPRRRSF